MSNSKMLIDATHPEETRVVVQRNGRVEEFDFESAARKLLRGNIYLAKVTRVEPSLQAAFVDYGGNRHGFLAFNEIHPDYYQIPVADRQALLDEEAAAEAELEAAADRRAEAMSRRSSGPGDVLPEDDTGSEDPTEQDADSAAADPSHIVDVEEDEHIEEIGGETSDEDEPKAAAAAVGHSADDERSEPHRASAADETGTTGTTDDSADQTVSDAQAKESEDLPAQRDAPESDDEQDDPEEGPPEDDGGNGGDVEKAQHERTARPRRRPRSYKIQEVIKRRQVILVQVVKEERGNKGAALTTYLSLAGRYTVLMPNTARGGGISRKITNPQDRRRLKAIAQDLEVPEGMGLIIRTAGAARTKQEIKRDFEYLLRLWESVRELTLQSTAPNLVYEEGDLIKRSIRDLYNKDVEEIVVAGDAGFEEAAAFMKMLMPSHARNVVAYGDPSPLFTRYGVERQLNAMFQPQVTLKSGGYIVINQTEALVAIDVNSGKSTREFSIEETALATNLEAADEIARQLKLRDLAGLIVIDFIDMEEKRNNRAVERRLKDALRFDRARIQLGRISHFGLMEMSRQRLRTGVLEGSTSQCPHCMGTGIIRSTESVALAVLRGLEDAITAGATGPLIATTTPAVALYILNSKRPYVADMEARHGHTITVLGSDRVHGANFTVERGAASVLPRRVQHTAVNMDWGFDTDEDDAASDSSKLAAADYERDDESRQPEDRDFEGRRTDGDEGGGRRGRRRRRRGRGGRDRNETRDSDAEADTRLHSAGEDDANAAADEEPSDQPTIDADAYGEKGSENGRDQPGRRRRRGRRGGRRGRDRKQSELAAGADDANIGDDASSEPDVPSAEPDKEPSANNGTGTSRKPSRRRSAAKSESDSADADSDVGKTQRQRRIWDAPSTDNSDDEQSAQSAAANGKPSEGTGEPDADAPQPARRRHESGSSEPRLERVVVKPGDQEDNDVAEFQTPPQRKGWWQRKFGGD